MSLLLLFADQESVQPSVSPGGPALERVPRHVLLPRPIFAYRGRATIHVAAAGQSSFIAGSRPAISDKAPVAAAPVPVHVPDVYRFTGSACWRISQKAMTSFHDPWIQARAEDEEMLLER